ncbi:MAG: hypothetical protein AAGG81_08360 [Chlamydiota bacterium]
MSWILSIYQKLYFDGDSSLNAVRSDALVDGEVVGSLCLTYDWIK